MKRLALLFAALFALSARQAFAQDANVITLNDSNPSVTAAISLPQDTTGVVALDLSMASVSLTDASGTVVFSSADPRVHMLELSIAPNSGTHTLTVERLPGAAQASARITSQAELTTTTGAQFVDTSTINLQQERALRLTTSDPAGQVTLNIPANTTGLISASFPGAVSNTQLADTSGAVIITSYRDIDGFSTIVDGGNYDFSLLAEQLTQDITAGVSAMPSDSYTLLAAPQAPIVQTNVTLPCTATVAASSVNLRSGPGTGYSVMNFGFLGDNFAVGGINPESNWIVVGTDFGSSWVSRDMVQLNGGCSNLNVYNIPLRDAQLAPIIVQPAPGGNNNVPGESENEGRGGGGENEGGSD